MESIRKITVLEVILPGDMGKKYRVAIIENLEAQGAQVKVKRVIRHG